MGGLKIIGASHPGRFARELGGKGKTESASTERYSAEFILAGGRCKTVHDYRTGEVFIWFEEKAKVEVLRRVLSLTRYLGKALVVGVLPWRGSVPMGEAFIEVPGGRVEIVHAGEGLWVGLDGNHLLFSATVQGLAELVELLGGEP